MKKLLPFYFLLIVVKSSDAQTNVYHPFPDSNAVWNVYWNCFVQGEAWLSYTMTGDTVITTTTYHKIAKPPVVHNGPCNVGGIAYQGAIREDTAARKVFIVYPFDTVEKVLFDFSLQVGDTFPANDGLCTNFQVVQTIDSILIGNNYRKRWIMALGPQFIEGIGSTWGFLEPNCAFLDFPATYLLCFKQNGQTLYPDSSANCEIFDFINALPAKNCSATLSPNPFHLSTNLEIQNMKTDIGICQLKIYNTMGALVRCDDVSHINSYVLHRGGLHTGVYFYELQNDNYDFFITGKFIIE